MNQYDQALEEVVALGQTFFESSPDCVKILDLEGRLLSMNGNGQCIMEIDSISNLCGLPWASVWPADSTQAVHAALEAARTGNNGHFTGFCPTAKGTPKWWDVIVSPIRGSEGQVSYLLSVSRDVTAVFQAKNEIQTTASRMQFAMQSAGLGEWEVDLVTGGVWCSLRHTQCFGDTGSVKEWSIEKFVSHVHREDQSRVRDIYATALEEHKPYHFETRIVWPDESIHWISVHGMVQVRDGKAARLHGIVKDITAEKRADLLVLGQKKAFELAVQGAALLEILEELVTTAEAQFGNTLFASILLLDPDGKRLRHAAAPSLPSAYTQAIDGVAIGPSTGSCATAAFLQQVVIVRDIQTDPLWVDYRDLALRHNLHACWSTPIMSSGGRLHGTFAFYYREARDPTAEECDAMSLLVNTAALVLDRHHETQQGKKTAAALQEAQTQLEATLAAAEISTWVWDLRTNQLHGDWHIARFYGRRDADSIEIPIETTLQSIHPHDRPHVDEAIGNTLQHRIPYEASYRIKDANGLTHAVVARGRLQYDALGKPIKLLGATLNVTRQRMAEKALSKSEERYRTLFELMDQGFCVIELLFDESGKPYDYRFLETNPKFVEQTGIADAIGKTALELFPNLEPQWIGTYGQVALTGKPLRFECESQMMARWFDVYATRIGQPSARQVAILFSDITERKRTEQSIREFNIKLEQQANYDSLTGLPNRRLFRDRLNQEIRHAHAEERKIALLFLDLDRFKEVNDLLGHDAGDGMLEQAAKRIQQCLGSADTAARLGGDEFTVIVTHPNEVRRVAEVAQRLLEALEQPFDLWHQQVRVSCSIGITVYPDDALLPEQLIRNADQAMYLAKSAGRNQLAFFKQSMQTDAVLRLKRIGELRRAVSEQQLELHFQPVIDLATGRVNKAEALVRWRHPVDGLLGPASFIGIAEETGLIHEIGDWVFQEALAQCTHWISATGQPFQVSINMSPLQLLHSKSTIDWPEQLQAAQLVPGSVVIEITEGVLLNMTDSVSDKLKRLRDSGFEFSIDDFGTGYSSLAYLKKLDVDYIKIDKSFVADMLHDSTAATIVETIILMAHKLELKVVAEGVETAEQRAWLQQHGCDYGQGYFFSRPIAAADFGCLLRKSLG